MNAEAASSKLTLEDHSFTPTPGASSNRFASGANPNAGNVLTERSSTRLSQAPGGSSSLCLGDDHVNAVAASPIQAPGGNSSINLGDDSASPAVGVAVKRTIKVRE